MKRNLLVSLSLATLVVTVIWVVLMIADVLTAAPVNSFEQALSLAQNRGVLFYLTYINAALVTVFTTMLMAGIYVYLRSAIHGWSAIAFAFVPAYAALNLFAYVSQITLLPALASLAHSSEAAQFVTAQMVQQWPQSIAAHVNLLAYAVLGIPLMIFGSALTRSSGWVRLAGFLLALSGAASIIGLLGAVVQSPTITMGVTVSGVLYLLALGPLAIGFNQERIV